MKSLTGACLFILKILPCKLLPFEKVQSSKKEEYFALKKSGLQFKERKLFLYVSTELSYVVLSLKNNLYSISLKKNILPNNPLSLWVVFFLERESPSVLRRACLFILKIFPCKLLPFEKVQSSKKEGYFALKKSGLQFKERKLFLYVSTELS